MESFEKLIGGLLEREGYWVKYGFKVELSKAEKARWELDIVAYKASNNEVLVVECKSYLDSPGVRYLAVVSREHRRSDRYKLFNDSPLRRVVLGRLVRQLIKAGACRSNPHVVMCLAAGKVVSTPDAEKLRALFEKRGWRLIGPGHIFSSLSNIAGLSYEDDVAAVVSKILIRDQNQKRETI